MSSDSQSNSGAEVTRRLKTTRVCTAEGSGEAVEETIDIAVEAPVEVDVIDFRSYTLMCSPIEMRAAAVGLLLTDGVIQSIEDIEELSEDADGRVTVRLNRPPSVTDGRRKVLVTSSGGLSASKSVSEIPIKLPPVGDSLRITAQAIRRGCEASRGHQRIFSNTGGTHAAGLFDADGNIFAFAEDIGRHNAVDKALGKALLAGEGPTGYCAALSGRVSFEMVTKCARAGAELIAAVSSPTSLAVEAAEQWNVTLCGFVRDVRATIYTHPRRVLVHNSTDNT